MLMLHLALIPDGGSIRREADRHSGRISARTLRPGVATFGLDGTMLTFVWVDDPAGAEPASPVDGKKSEAEPTGHPDGIIPGE